MTLEIRDELAPVIDWYQSDEHPGRSTADIVRDVVADLQEDRKAALILHRIVLVARRKSGDEAHRIMPEIWPHICEADKLPSMLPGQKSKVLSMTKTTQELVADAAAKHGLTPQQILGHSRRRDIVRARWEAWNAARDQGWTISKIASEFNRDHTTILHGLARTV